MHIDCRMFYAKGLCWSLDRPFRLATRKIGRLICFERRPCTRPDTSCRRSWRPFDCESRERSADLQSQAASCYPRGYTEFDISSRHNRKPPCCRDRQLCRCIACVGGRHLFAPPLRVRVRFAQKNEFYCRLEPSVQQNFVFSRESLAQYFVFCFFYFLSYCLLEKSAALQSGRRAFLKYY